MKNLIKLSVFVVLAVLFLPLSGFPSNPISTMPVDNFVTAYKDGSFTVTRGDNFKAFFTIDKDNPNEVEVTILKDDKAVHVNAVVEAAGYTFKDSTFSAIAIPVYANPAFFNYQPTAVQPSDGSVIENQGGTVVRSTTVTTPATTSTTKFNAPGWVNVR